MYKPGSTRVLLVAAVITGLAAWAAVVVVTTCSLMGRPIFGRGAPATVRWDFTRSHAKSVVGWPTRHGNEVFASASASTIAGETWAVDRRTLSGISITLPGRPVLNLPTFQHAYIDEENGQILSITICCEPTTRGQALAQLHDAAVRWGWSWQDSDYANWGHRVDGGIQSSIGAGDFRSPLWPPTVSADIRPEGDTAWFIEWDISWRPQDRQ